MERKRNLKRRLMALLMALLIIGGSVIPTAYDLVSLAEGQESETGESSASIESSEAPEESTAAPAGQVSAQNETDDGSGALPWQAVRFHHDSLVCGENRGDQRGLRPGSFGPGLPERGGAFRYCPLIARRN